MRRDRTFELTIYSCYSNFIPACSEQVRHWLGVSEIPQYDTRSSTVWKVDMIHHNIKTLIEYGEFVTCVTTLRLVSSRQLGEIKIVKKLLLTVLKYLISIQTPLPSEQLIMCLSHQIENSADSINKA